MMMIINDDGDKNTGHLKLERIQQHSRLSNFCLH